MSFSKYKQNHIFLLFEELHKQIEREGSVFSRLRPAEVYWTIKKANDNPIFLNAGERCIHHPIHKKTFSLVRQDASITCSA